MVVTKENAMLIYLAIAIAANSVVTGGYVPLPPDKPVRGDLAAGSWGPGQENRASPMAQVALAHRIGTGPPGRTCFIAPGL